MGTGAIATEKKQSKWQKHDIRFLHSTIKVEVLTPTADPLTFPSYQRKRYGCKFIDSVEPAGTRSVYITATNCTHTEAAYEYLEIVNKLNGYAADDEQQDEV